METFFGGDFFGVKFSANRVTVFEFFFFFLAANEEEFSATACEQSTTKTNITNK